MDEALGALLLFIVTLLHSYRVARVWKKEPSVHDSLMVDIGEDELHIVSQHEDGRIKWSAFSRFLETKNLFLIFRQRNVFNVIPKRIFRDASEIENFRQLLKKKLLSR